MKLTNTLVIATALVSTLIACSQQGQGERCLTANGDADCESGLVCTPKDELRESLTKAAEYAADRCCPPIDGPRWSDARCEPRGPRIAAAGGSSNATAGAGGAATTGDDSTSSGGVAGTPDNTTVPSENGGSASTAPNTSSAGNGA